MLGIAVAAALLLDMVMLATPVGGMASVMASMRDRLRTASVLTDAGSTKGNVIAAARAALGDRIGQFVPGHPIAGGERTGPDAAFATLYEVLTTFAKVLAPVLPFITEQMYQGLKSRGIDAELVIYPGEFHTISRPSFLKDRMERWLAWYAAYMPKEPGAR